MKKVIAAILLLGFGTAGAESVSYSGYTLDADTSIVTGGGLEWLQWDVTLGQSVNTALGNHAASGWRVASNVEMSALLNAFSFGLTFDAMESTAQSVGSPDDGYKAANFIALFGETQLISDKRSQAMYGTDLNNNGRINHLYIEDRGSSGGFGVYDYSDNYSPITFTTDKVLANAGVALVRVSGVPVPAAVWLFGSGLVLLGWIRRKPIV